MENISTNIQISEKVLTIIKLVKEAISNSPTGVSFFSIKNYGNSMGEISNYVINIGINYEKSKLQDIKFLRELDLGSLNSSTNRMVLEKARLELITAFEAPSENRSNGQINAYTQITQGVKVHNESGKLYIYGYKVYKKVITPCVPKEVKSSELTLAKNELRSLLKTSRFSQYCLEIGNSLKANGNTIEI